MTIICEGCKRCIMRRDRRYRANDQLKAVNGAVIDVPHRQAPRLLCPCGRVTILLKGKVG